MELWLYYCRTSSRLSIICRWWLALANVLYHLSSWPSSSPYEKCNSLHHLGRMLKDGMSSLMIMTSSRIIPKRPNPPLNHLMMHFKTLLTKCLSSLSESVSIGNLFDWKRNPNTRTEALELLKDEWIVKGLPDEFKKQHMKFIAE